MTRTLVAARRKPATLPRAVTLHDVAREAGVAVSTASTALSGGYGVAPGTRAMVRETALRLGFQPNPHARNLIKGRSTDLIGLLAISLDLGVVTSKLQALGALLGAHRYITPIYTLGPRVGGDQLALVNNLIRQQPLAIVCNTHNLDPPSLEVLRDYGNKGGVVVCYDYLTSAVSGCDHVIFDRQHNTGMAARHLVELGHEHIALYDSALRGPHAVRFEGYRLALAEAGLKLRRQWLFAPSSGVQETGPMLGVQFLALKERPTAICIGDDLLAAGFISYLQRHGVRVPDDVSVVGADNLYLADASAVPLTTVTQPIVAIAEAVVALLTDRLNGHYDGPPRKVWVRGELIVRESTAPP